MLYYSKIYLSTHQYSFSFLWYTFEYGPLLQTTQSTHTNINTEMDQHPFKLTLALLNVPIKHDIYCYCLYNF